MSQSMSNLSPSSVVPASLNAERPSSRTNQRGGHPLPDSTATSLDANSSPSSKSQKRSRKRRKDSSQPGTHALPRVRTGMSQESIRRTLSTQDGSLQRPLTPPDTPTVESSSVLAFAFSSSQENTSASALLLNDLGMPAAQTNPPAKRRKVTSTQPPPPSAPIRSPRSNGHGIAPVPLPGSQSGRVSVKRERSPSPPLARLVTQGCVRVAPLPPNCRKTHSGYQAARQELAKAEMDKIRKLGLHPTRVFTREDGMVIDWCAESLRRMPVADFCLVYRKSDIPVLPDTLRPPSVEQQRAAEKVAARPEKERDAPRTRAAQQSRAPESRPRADTQDEAMVQDYLSRASPVVREDAAQSVASPSAEVHIHQHTSQVPPQKSSDREKRPNLHVVNQLSTQMDVIDLTEDDDGIAPIVDQSFSGTASRPASSAAYDDTGPSSIPASSHAVLSNGSGSDSRPTPKSITAPDLNTSNRVSLPRTVSISSDNSDVDEMEAAALDFLKKCVYFFSIHLSHLTKTGHRYMIAFSEDRAVLVRAYSRMATLSIITPSDSPITPSSRQTPYQGRADIVSALLALPDEQALYDEDGEGMAEVDWDLVYVEATGDVLLICYATHDRSPGAKTNEKSKGKRRADRWAYEQRFLLRRKEWDVEDR